ncbi:MAG: hypothetical protein AB8B60_03365 [Sulfitobacter sp.]
MREGVQEHFAPAAWQHSPQIPPLRPKSVKVFLSNCGMTAHLLFYAVLILVPVLLFLFCFFVLPVIYALLWVRTFDRLGNKRALLLFADMSAVFILAWIIKPPKVYYKPAVATADLLDRISANIKDIQNGLRPELIPEVLDWWRMFWALIAEPPWVLYIAVFGGIWVLRKASAASQLRKE